MSYFYYNANPEGKSEPDCTVRAISFLLQQSWDKTFDDICAVAKEMKSMPSVNRVWGRYLMRKGYMPHFIPNTCPWCFTVRDFCKDNPRGEFLLALDEHVVVVVNGNYYDTWDSGGEIPFYFWKKEY
jgi:hypothetical protein